MAKQTVVFMGSKPIGYHCLEFLLHEAEKMNISVIGILTNDNSRFDAKLSLRELAHRHQIQLIDSLSAMPSCDYIISVQYHEILKQADIDKAQKLAMNLHMAPLPEYRGCNQFTFAILDNKKVFGTTLHKMDARIDHGDIIAEKRFDIPEHCWVHQLYELTYQASLDLFREQIALILSGQYSLTPQQELEAQRGCSLHYRTEINDVKHIDLAWDKEKIERHIRATYMPGFEPPYTTLHDEKIYFTTAW
jgi:methionyl-tRNA formyltransferase